MSPARISPETRAYIRKTEAFVAGRDPMKLLAAAPGKYERAVRGLSGAQLGRRPARDKWSIAEIIGHVSDSEVVYGYRWRRILAGPKPTIEGYDQDLWADTLRYRRRSVPQMLRKYRALREDHLAMLRSATRAERARFGVHAERGRESADRIVFLLSGHDLNHLAQIAAIRKKFGW